LLGKVRDEYGRLVEVVRAFGGKVDIMVEKQRIEYMQAYENHMQDVQKELYFLREKVNEIANDLTKEEKIKSLEADQQFYRNETLSLDSSNNELRKKLRMLTGRMRSVGKRTIGKRSSECDTRFHILWNMSTIHLA
jgi:chromosome segregation ATPase